MGGIEGPKVVIGSSGTYQPCVAMPNLSYPHLPSVLARGRHERRRRARMRAKAARRQVIAKTKTL